MSKLSDNALTTLKNRYFLRNSEGEIIENEQHLWHRIAKAVSEPELDKNEWYWNFSRLLEKKDFLPNTPTIMNAGKENGQLSACFVLPIEDKLAGGGDTIFGTLDHMALIHQTGGGTGFDFSRLRPEGSMVSSKLGVSTGPLSFCKVYDAATESVKQGACFSGSTRIQTNKGLIEAENLAERIEAGERFEASTHKGYSPISFAFRNGKHSIYRVSTERGHKVEITFNHKVAVLREGEVVTVELNKLKVEDEILVHLGTNVASSLLPLKEAKLENRSTLNKSVKQPEVLNEDVAYFLGQYFADGCVLKKRGAPSGFSITVSSAWPEIKDKLVSTVESVFGVVPKVETCVGDWSNVKVHSRLLSEFLILNGLEKQRAKDVRVPDLIFESPESVQCAFIEGYIDADGFDLAERGGIGVSSTSEKMLEDMQLLLVSNGIESRISIDRAEQGNWRALYRLTITGGQFRERARELIGSIKIQPYKTKGSHGKAYPKEVKNALKLRSKHLNGKWDGKGRISHSVLTEVLEEINEEDADKLFSYLKVLPDKIISIDEIGEQDTFDFEVEGVHLLSGGGIYTSNSRRGANMMTLRVDHPDILEFIDMKMTPGVMTNFNVSVTVTDEFMEALKNDTEYELKHDFTGVTGKLRARDVWDKIADNAWKSAEPGLIFIDRVNSKSPYWERIETTNPCGEQPLPAYGSCNLGSINLSNFVSRDGTVDWERLKKVVAIAVRFLDNVIDVNVYPIPEIEEHTKRYRNIGLGVMGWADMLIKLKIPYNSEEAIELGEKVMEFINKNGHKHSELLAKEKGAPLGAPFRNGPAYGNSNRRNATVTTVAPTGTLCIIAGCSSGIEPNFAFEYEKHVMDTILTEYHPLYEKAKNNGGVDSSVFMDAHRVDPTTHVEMQAAFQKHCDSGISKTINLHSEATVEDVKDAYLRAWKSGCKGITVYRDGSRGIGVLHRKDEPKVTEEGYCIECGGELIQESGCETCASCGWSKCLIS